MHSLVRIPHRDTRGRSGCAIDRRGQRRAAFTIVELLVVITIIGILLALIVPAVTGGTRAARIAAVKTEISGLDKGITDFKVTYGTEPPSSIRITEDLSALLPEDKAKLRSIFGLKMDFTGNYDLDGNGVDTDTHVLSGQQCLVFFLGGPVTRSGGNLIPQGFSKNPSRPFKVDSGNRQGPFVEFVPGQIIDNGTNTFPSYSAPNGYGTYVYVHADDYKAPAAALAGTGMSAPYFLDAAGNNFHKPKTYQIIAAGNDENFGSGGQYDSENSDAVSEADRDNITNFSSGALAN